mgnify:CR=1 FL=1
MTHSRTHHLLHRRRQQKPKLKAISQEGCWYLLTMNPSKKMHWLSSLAVLIISSIVGADAFAVKQLTAVTSARCTTTATTTSSCLSMAQDNALETKQTATLTEATNWRLRLLLNGVTTTQGRKIDGQLFVLNGNFIEEEGYEPPQGIFKSIASSSNEESDDESNSLSLEINNSRWTLSEDPDDRKDGLWIWGLGTRILQPGFWSWDCGSWIWDFGWRSP